MSQLSPTLKRFAIRVRLVRAWAGFAIGGTAGAVLALTWAALDFFRVFYTEWPYLLLTVLVPAFVGALIGVLLRLKEKDLASSIDRRGKLEDRLSTSISGLDSSFREVQQQDALASLERVKAAKVYPIRLSRWHGALVLGGIIAAALFLMGNSPLLLNSQQKADREKLKEQAAVVERVARPLLDKVDKTSDEKQLANQLEQYRDELKKARLSPPEAMQKANDLVNKADDMAKSDYTESQKDMDSAQDALDKMQADALKAQGMNVDPNLLKNLEKNPVPPNAAQDLQNQIDKLKQQLNSGKDDHGNKLSEAKKMELSKQMEELEKELSQVKYSQKVLDMMAKLAAQPEWQKLMKMLQDMQKNAQSGKAGQQPTLTKEQMEQIKQQIKEMEKQLEALADRLKDDKAMQEFIKEMEDSLKNMQLGGDKMGIGLGLFNLPSMGVPGPGNGTEVNFANTHQIPLSKDPHDIKAKSDPRAIRGERAAQGTETYIEVKGPSGVGSKSRTPYVQVFKQYRKQAEQALDRQQIPPDQQKRVKDYFDSLQEGGQ
ncbi:MAG TPA: hypothetical protein VGL56_15145 [Fimbriimonadaceae bacterium]|jgi:hypothetical protein